MTNTEALGLVLYTRYVYFFQAAGLVLLVAMIGAIVLTLRHRPTSSARTSARRSRARATTRSKCARSVRGRGSDAMVVGLGHYLAVAAILFTLGILGIFLNRKNVIVILMSIELILLSVNINLVAFSAYPRRPRRPGVRAARAHGRGRGGGDRACHPGRRSTATAARSRSKTST